jgi:alcohol dehydrogenase class IV
VRTRVRHDGGFVGLGGTTVEEKLIVATEQLLASWRSQGSIAELGISREEFEQAMPELVKNAFDDPSRRSNPAHATDD